MKDSFIEAALKMLLKEGITTKRLRSVLAAGWDNGAITALLSPEAAFQSVNEEIRKEHALEMIETLAADHLKNLDIKVSSKVLREWAEESLEGDDSYPVAVLTAGDDWIIGRRSDN